MNISPIRSAPPRPPSPPFQQWSPPRNDDSDMIGWRATTPTLEKQLQERSQSRSRVLRKKEKNVHKGRTSKSQGASVRNRSLAMSPPPSIGSTGYLQGVSPKSLKSQPLISSGNARVLRSRRGNIATPQDIIKEDQIRYRKVRNYSDVPNRSPPRVEVIRMKSPTIDFRFEQLDSFPNESRRNRQHQQNRSLRKHQSFPELCTAPHSFEPETAIWKLMPPLATTEDEEETAKSGASQKSPWVCPPITGNCVNRGPLQRADVKAPCGNGGKARLIAYRKDILKTKRYYKKLVKQLHETQSSSRLLPAVRKDGLKKPCNLIVKNSFNSKKGKQNKRKLRRKRTRKSTKTNRLISLMTDSPLETRSRYIRNRQTKYKKSPRLFKDKKMVDTYLKVLGPKTVSVEFSM